jgi:hypothetical protein
MKYVVVEHAPNTPGIVQKYAGRVFDTLRGVSAALHPGESITVRKYNPKKPNPGIYKAWTIRRK